MTPQVLLVDGYVTMYMELDNTGSEPLTFLNTLYDIEPTRLYNPTVAFPWIEPARRPRVDPRRAASFPARPSSSPATAPCTSWAAWRPRAPGLLATPVANIKFCPTRGMDDVPARADRGRGCRLDDEPAA